MKSMNQFRSEETKRKVYFIQDPLHRPAANDNSLPWRKKWRIIIVSILIGITLLWAFL